MIRYPKRRTAVAAVHPHAARKVLLTFALAFVVFSLLTQLISQFLN